VKRNITNIRNDYIHKVTHELVSMLPRRITMEDLNIEGMLHNHKDAKGTQDVGWGKFIEYMRYKCETRGIEFIQADRFFPSSKLCSTCGSKHPNLKRSDTVYVCPVCGTRLDRDYNAALNLERYTDQLRESVA
jgi:putative transposase